ncbi:MAG: flagellar basal body P-ring protein FlgI [Pseudomonadota bacterium]
MYRAAHILLTAIAIAAVACIGVAEAAKVRLKDLVEIEGVRGNDLVGFGLVVGLDGTGDGLRNSPYTEEALSSLLERLGVNVRSEDFRPNNVAAVLVTATLPPFARTGMQIVVNVSANGDAQSLQGGTLVMTPLNAADGRIYAVGQGPIIVSGFNAQGQAGSVTEGVPTAGIVPNGARVERELPFDFADLETLRLSLRSPDFTTAARIEAAINKAAGDDVAKMLDSAGVEVRTNKGFSSPAHMMSALENIEVEPAQKARIVVDQRSGTIVLGANVRISSVAVAQGNLSIRIAETPFAVQPNPFSRQGETVVLPRTDIQVDQNADRSIAVLEENVTLADLVGGLNALGVSPREMIDILKSIKSAGALHAELLVQ